MSGNTSLHVFITDIIWRTFDLLIDVERPAIVHISYVHSYSDMSNAKPKTLPTNWALDMNMSVPT